MSIKFQHTRHKCWGWGFFYLLPTLRLNWSLCKGIDFGKLEDFYTFKIELLWLTFKITAEWEHAKTANGTSR